MIFGSLPEQAVQALRLRLKHAAVLYCDRDVAKACGVGPQRGKAWAPHRRTPHGRSHQSRSMVRLTDAGATRRHTNKRFVCPDKQHPHLFKFVLDTIDRPDDPEHVYSLVPRALAMMVGHQLSSRRIWLHDLASVVWVCSWPWGPAWGGSALHQGLPGAREHGEVSVWLDQLQADGDPLGEALSVWLAAKSPTLEQALAVYSATRPIREKFGELVAAEAAHAKVCSAAQNVYWIERTRARNRGEEVPSVQEDPFCSPTEPGEIELLRGELRTVGELRGMRERAS